MLDGAGKEKPSSKNSSGFHTDMPFNGKVALVTGGTRGIGLAVASKLESMGASVIRWGLTSGIIVDVRNEKDVERSAALEIATHGRIDILVNSAGVFGPMKPLHFYSLDEYRNVMETNVTGTFLAMKAIVPQMVKNGYGRVVNLSSVVGRDANPMAPVYSASKAAVIRMTQAIGRDLAATGVLVNCVAPSAALTDLFKNAPPEQLEIMRKKVPMGRLATVEEIAELICWLCSEQMTYSAGAVFDCSGGRHD